MELENGLSIAALTMCLVTLSLATAALMPQIKQAVILVRDGVLWLALVVLIGTVAAVGWIRFFKVHFGGTPRATVVREAASPVTVPVRVRSVVPVQPVRPRTTTPQVSDGNETPGDGDFTANRSWPTNSTDSARPR